MTTAVFLGMMLAFERPEPGIMLRPPRDPRVSLLTGALLRRIVLVSILLCAGAFALFKIELLNGASKEAGVDRRHSRVRVRRGVLSVQLPLAHPVRTVCGPLLQSVDLGRDRRDDVAATCLHVCTGDECAFPLSADRSRVLASGAWSGTRDLCCGRVREVACLSSGQPPRPSQIAERAGEGRTRCPRIGEARLGEEDDAG